MAETAGVQLTGGSQPGVPLADLVPPLTPKQMWAARLLLGWSRECLAGRAGTTSAYVSAYERDGRVTKMTWRNRPIDGLAAIRTALEQAGVELIEENGDGAGVKLRKVVEGE